MLFPIFFSIKHDGHNSISPVAPAPKLSKKNFPNKSLFSTKKNWNSACVKQAKNKQSALAYLTPHILVLSPASLQTAVEKNESIVDCLTLDAMIAVVSLLHILGGCFMQFHGECRYTTDNRDTTVHSARQRCWYKQHRFVGLLKGNPLRAMEGPRICL